jgi:hypothetical protein
MKRLFAILLLSSISLHAADNAAPAAPNTTSLKLAREVIEATQTSKMLDGMSTQLQQMLSQQLTNLAANLPEAERANLQAAQKEMVEFVIEQSKQLVSKMDVIYAEVFTEKELTAIKTFYQSPEGRALVEKQPTVMQLMMPSIVEMQKGINAKMEEILNKHGLAPQKAQK